jgi:hypothetical protein
LREGSSTLVIVTARELGFVIRIVTSPDPPGKSAATGEDGPAADMEMPDVRVGSEAPPTEMRREIPTSDAAYTRPTHNAAASPSATKHECGHVTASTSQALGSRGHATPAEVNQKSRDAYIGYRVPAQQK